MWPSGVRMHADSAAADPGRVRWWSLPRWVPRRPFFFLAGGSRAQERADGLMTLEDHCLATRRSSLGTINRRASRKRCSLKPLARWRTFLCGVLDARGNKEVRIRLAI
ncbi:hypothetical protein MRX96_043229 [Rhipicephalus microplus]